MPKSHQYYLRKRKGKLKRQKPQVDKDNDELDKLIDRNNIVENIHKRIKLNCPDLNISQEAVGNFVENILNKDDDYQEKEDLNEIELEQLCAIKQYLKETTPNIKQIINSPLTLHEKARALEIYTLYKHSLEETEEHLTLSNTLKYLLGESKLNSEQLIKLEFLREQNEKETPTLKNIIEASIPQKQKQEAIRLYDIMIHTDIFCETRLNLENKINQIIQSAKYFQANNIDIDNFEKTRKYYEKLATPNDIELQVKIFNLKASKATKTKIYEMYLKMKNYPANSSEYASMYEKINWAINLPHNNIKMIDLNDKSPRDYCKTVKLRLDKHLYGLPTVKSEIIRLLNNRIYNPKTRTMLGLCGEPGLGKTMVAKALAKSLDLPFERISLGGISDPSVFRGSDGVWVGSAPSIIIQILKRMAFANGVILFDELDKVDKNIQYALLHITDYTQNKDFQDLYLNEFPHDLSNIWFMFAMNHTLELDPALLDRIKIIHLSPYSKDDKIQIIKNHLVPRISGELGISPEQCSIDKKACNRLIEISASTSIRPLENYVNEIISNINMKRTKSDKNIFPYKICIEDVNEIAPKRLEHLPYYM